MTINSTNENDCEVKRIEVLNDELERLHKLLAVTNRKAVSEWALARINEMQAMLVSSEFIVNQPAYEDDNEDMN